METKSANNSRLISLDCGLGRILTIDNLQRPRVRRMGRLLTNYLSIALYAVARELLWYFHYLGFNGLC